MWSSLSLEVRAVMMYINTWVGAIVVLFNGWLEVFEVSDHSEMM
jgi:hypothetical protein